HLLDEAVLRQRAQVVAAGRWRHSSNRGALRRGHRTLESEVLHDRNACRVRQCAQGTRVGNLERVLRTAGLGLWVCHRARPYLRAWPPMTLARRLGFVQIPKRIARTGVEPRAAAGLVVP